MYKAIIFDLDGTLLDTISDITLALNVSLKTCGYTFSYDVEGTKKLIGMGARNIVFRALKDHPYTEAEFTRLLDVFSANYQTYQDKSTLPYTGIVPFLKECKRAGIRLFVASNKPDRLAKAIVGRLFENGLFDDVRGHCDGYPEKPDPYLVDSILGGAKIERANALFVGDSDVDVETGLNAHISACLVLWGYGDYRTNLLKRATCIAHSISDLKTIVFA